MSADMISRISDLYISSSNSQHEPSQSVQIINIHTPSRKVKKRIAAYCRVSTEKDAQLESLENQLEGFRNKVLRKKDWELVEVYVDQGISGTSMKNRSGFMRMYEDCTEGKIDCILTKSISRFARNTIDCLSWIEKFKQCGVPIIFEKEGINTEDLKSQMILTVMSCFAQEESHSISENVKWGMKKLHESGREIPIPIFGYRHTEEQQYIIVPEEAEVVKEVFHCYVQGETPTTIVNRMNENNIPPPAGDCWKLLQVYRMLHNEKYIGDVVYQKHYVESYLTHKEVRNNGELPFVQLCNVHPAIIERNTFVQAQKILAMRRVKSGNGSYPYGDMLKCPYCGNIMLHGSLDCLWIKQGRKKKGGWGCFGEGGCRKYLLLQSLLDPAMIKAYDDKYHVRKEKVDFFWLDDSMESIRLTIHNSVEICWKDGSKTKRMMSVDCADFDPVECAGKYNRFLEKVRSGERKTKSKYLLGL